MPTKKRIILSGTPVQNNLDEFYHMVSFVNPGVLGDYKTFKSEFGNIQDDRNSTLTIEKDNGNSQMNKLIEKTKLFILRRSNDINAGFLKTKTEFVIFLKLSDHLKDRYCAKIDEYDELEESTVLSQLTTLKKLSNHSLSDQVTLENYKELIDQSNKYLFIQKLLSEMKSKGEKVVLVSHWTFPLDVFEKYLTEHEVTFVRLDGSTPAQQRQIIVDKFNTQKSVFCFLLSSKAGGVGLNLIGASRLIMMDIDWNPSVDQQAMARVWRDGQVKPVFIYRLISAGTIEERIYQRQLVKTSLSDSMMKNEKSNVSFSKEELKELFTYVDTECLVHDLLKCKCGGNEKHLSVPFKGVVEWKDEVLGKVLENSFHASFIMASSTDVKQ
jgi:DNA repair and recombination protein RAD54B